MPAPDGEACERGFCDPRKNRVRSSGVAVNLPGPGKVTFDPPISPVVHGQPVTLTSKASFSAPGTYVLRAIAFDGQLLTINDVNVTVNPGADQR